MSQLLTVSLSHVPHCKPEQVNFITEGNNYWGGMVIGLTFLPMAVLLAGWAVSELKEKRFCWWQWLLALPLSPLLLAGYIVAVAIATP